MPMKNAHRELPRAVHERYHSLRSDRKLGWRLMSQSEISVAHDKLAAVPLDTAALESCLPLSPKLGRRCPAISAHNLTPR
jgi:hypothetical protein